MISVDNSLIQWIRIPFFSFRFQWIQAANKNSTTNSIQWWTEWIFNTELNPYHSISLEKCLFDKMYDQYTILICVLIVHHLLFYNSCNEIMVSSSSMNLISNDLLKYYLIIYFISFSRWLSFITMYFLTSLFDTPNRLHLKQN